MDFKEANRLKISKERLILVTLSIMSIVVVAAYAYVYEISQSEVTQTIKNITTISLANAGLGDIEEGQTMTYTKTENPALGGIVNLTTTKDNVYLYFNSDIAALSTYYTTYTITVKFAAVGAGSTYTLGSQACIMTLEAPTPSAITLDKLGTWSFDFEVITTAKSVSSDQPTIATITVSAENS